MADFLIIIIMGYRFHVELSNIFIFNECGVLSRDGEHLKNLKYLLLKWLFASAQMV